MLQAIASVTLTHGRLGFAQLVRFSKQKPRTVRAAILVLVQHNLLWHAQSDDEGEVFEMNVDECLLRLRYGRYVWLAEQLYGKPVRLTPWFTQFDTLHIQLQGAEIVELVLDHGKLRPPDIISQLSVYDPIKGTNSITSGKQGFTSRQGLPFSRRPCTSLSTKDI